MNKNKAVIFALGLIGSLIGGCQPKTPAEKVMNKVEDATHETGQAIERAGERVKGAGN